MCSNLKSLDLSSFRTSNVSFMNMIFQGCSNLEYLDISNFDFGNLQMENYFSFNKIKYINLYNARNYESNVVIVSESNFILIQKENFYIPDGAIPTYCDTNKSLLKCESDNYITVKYKESVIYESGFIIKNCESRKGISYIIYKD